MINRIASSTFAAAVFATALAAGCSSSSSTSDATLTIVNQETFDITDIYIGPSDGTYPTTDNLLGSVPLQPGDSITVSVACDTYDVEIIDATNTDCYVAAYNLCGTDDQWDLDDAFFNTCASSPRLKPTVSNLHVAEPGS